MRAATIFLSLVLMLAAFPFSGPSVAQDLPAVSTADSVSSQTATNNTTGVADATQTPAESCRASCTREFELCGDEGSSSDQSMMGRPSAGFSKNHCNARMKDCIAGCKGL